MATLLDVKGLTTHFDTKAGTVHAVENVSLSLGYGEILGLVGESGSGKSVTGFSILGLIDPPGRIVAGSVRFEDQELIGLSQESLRKVRGRRIAMVFQDPMMTLNPVLSIGTQMRLALLAHEKVSRRAARARSIDMLARVGLADAANRLSTYPHQYSGGMRQRVAIALALLHRPAVIIADEPTTALDVSVQAQILAEMKSIVAEFRTSVIWITHDLAVISTISQRVAVMYAGRIVEEGPTPDILSAPRHPYTLGLLNSLPSRSSPRSELAQITGVPMSVLGKQDGCSFRNRCSRSIDKCTLTPEFCPDGGHFVRCHNPVPCVSLEHP